MANDLWRTPPEVFNTLNKEFNFIADMAASEENALHSDYFTEKQDSLSFDWSWLVGGDFDNSSHEYVWLNCPYSNPMPWVKKALEAQSNGLGVVMLLNADDSVGWFAEALKGVSEIRRIIGYEKEGSPGKYKSGRLAFLDAEGKPSSGNNKAQFILVFNPFKIGLAVTTYIKKSELMGEV